METINYLFILNIAYRLTVVIVVALVVLWSIKKGQFNKMNRGSSLPLEIDVENNNNSENKT